MEGASEEEILFVSSRKRIIHIRAEGLGGREVGDIHRRTLTNSISSGGFYGRDPVHAELRRYVDLTLDVQGRKKVSEKERSIRYLKFHEMLDSKEQRGFPVNECLICLSSFLRRSSCGRIRCGHLFHKTCLKRWIRVGSVCPTCRVEIKEE
jgi:Ring finger domain